MPVLLMVQDWGVMQSNGPNTAPTTQGWDTAEALSAVWYADYGGSTVAAVASQNLGPDLSAVSTNGGALRHVLLSYLKYYNEVRTHLSLDKDAPVSRAVERAGSILCRPVLGGLHHQYVRI